MDDSQSNTNLGSNSVTNAVPQQPGIQNKRSKWPFILLCLVLLLVIAGVDFGVYKWQKNKVQSLSNDESQLSAKVANLQQQISGVTNQNNGIVNKQSSNSTGANLDNNQVSYTIPSGWVEATVSKYATQCYNGYYASTVSCLDTTVIVPIDLNTNSSTSSYGGINISIYKHTDGTTAQNWYWNDLLGGLSPDTSDTTSTSSINGYSTYYLNQGNESLTYGSQFNDEYYVLTNNSYAVVLSSNVKNNNSPNGTTKTNDNSQYSPTVKSVAQSIKMQGN